MDGPQATIRLASDAGGWVKINPDQVGFYRVNYGGDGWERLRPAVEGMEVSAIDRLGLQNDAFALARAAYLPVTQFLSLAQSYVNETNAIVWEDVSANFGKIDLLVADEPYYDRFAAMMRSVYGPAGERVGWEARPGERELDALMRSTILGQLGKYDDEATLGTAASLFERYTDEPAEVHPDIRGVVFNLAAQQGDESTYGTIWDLYDGSPLEEEKMRLLMALGNFSDTALLGETLDRSLSDRVRYHDTIQVVSGVAANRLGRDMAWDFVKENWDEFSRRYSDGLFALSQAGRHHRPLHDAGEAGRRGGLLRRAPNAGRRPGHQPVPGDGAAQRSLASPQPRGLSDLLRGVRLSNPLSLRGPLHKLRHSGESRNPGVAGSAMKAMPPMQYMGPYGEVKGLLRERGLTPPVSRGGHTRGLPAACLRAYVFVDIRPVDSLAIADDLEVLALLRSGARQPPRPGQGDTDHPAIDEGRRDQVVRDVYRGDSRFPSLHSVHPMLPIRSPALV